MNGDSVRTWICGADPGFAQALARALGAGFESRIGDGLQFSLTPDLESWGDVVLVDLRSDSATSPRNIDLPTPAEIVQKASTLPVVVLVAADERREWLRLMESGAYDVVTSPPDIVELRLVLRRAHRFRRMQQETDQLRTRRNAPGRLGDLIGASDSMQEVFALARRIAPCDVTVLITGETGTGKELLARAIHQLSPRGANPFVPFSCANLPETLVEDELFGHEKGAFTGALAMRRGRLEAADRGTLFLDEVGDLGIGLQPKFLRVLQERTFERLGANTPTPTNLRIVCATNQDLQEQVRQGRFREDLFYRLNVVQIHLPPLRERRDDIPFLAQHFLDHFTSQFNRRCRRFSRLAIQALEEHDWPGNVRELENVVQRATVLTEGSAVDLSHLPACLRAGSEPMRVERSYEGEVREFKRRLLLRALRECGWRKTETARTLGMARNYLHRLINQLGIEPEPDVDLTRLTENVPGQQRPM